MAERLFGLETEYALTALSANGEAVDRDETLMSMMDVARAKLPSLPDGTGRGLFLQAGARLYIDAPDHPEYSTPGGIQSVGRGALRPRRRGDVSRIHGWPICSSGASRAASLRAFCCSAATSTTAARVRLGGVNRVSSI